MRKTKKILSFILVAAMALTMFVPMVAATNFSDVPATYRYYNAVESLAARGIINGIGDGKFAPDANVKRDEFAKIVCIGIVGSGEIPPSGGSGFTDVAAERWSSGYIRAAAAAGIINGMGDGTFAPENPVTYEQAVKMLVCALGYTKTAENKGGYPDGYLAVGGAIGLLKNVVLTDSVKGVPASRGLIAKLVDNALTVEVVDPLTGQISGSIAEKDSTKSVKGQIVSVPGATLLYYDEDGSPYVNPCGKNYIQIDDELYSIKDYEIDNIKSWLGRTVVAYYEKSEDDNEKYITSLSKQKNANDAKMINLSDISDYENTTVEYWSEEDGNYIDVDVDSDAILIYNGAPVDPDTNSLKDLLDSCSDASGSIELLDAFGNNSASVVFLKVYIPVLVNQITSAEYKVYNGLSGSPINDIILNPKDRSKDITFTKDGKASSFSAIRNEAVLSIARSENGNIIDVIIKDNAKKSGTVNELRDSGRIVKIGSVEYAVAEIFKTEASNLFDVDASVTVYVDAFGQIVYGTIAASDDKYAYLVAAEKQGTTDEELYVQLYNISSTGKLKEEILKLDEKVKINGVTYSDDLDGILTKLSQSAYDFNQGEAATGAGVYTQPIKYKSNNGVIKQMIVFDAVESVNELNRGKGSVLMVDNLEADSLTVTGNGIIGGYTVSGNTYSLVVPANRMTGEYKAQKGHSGGYTPGNAYKVQFIDASAMGIPKVALVYGSPTMGTANINSVVPAFVKSITNVSLGEGKSAVKLTVVDMNGVEKEYYEDEDTSRTALRGATNTWTASYPTEEGHLGGLEVGDIVKVTANSESIIDELMIVVDADKVVSQTQAAAIAGDGDYSSQQNAQYRYYLGSVRAVDSLLKQLQVTKAYVNSVDGTLADVNVETYDSSIGQVADAKVFVVDTSLAKDKRIKAGGFADLVGANTTNVAPENISRIFMYQTSQSIKMIVIFK